MPSILATTRATARPFRVLIAGGCYAGLASAMHLLKNCSSADRRPPIPIDITIVDERDGYYHIIGTPLAMATKEYAKKAWVEFKDIPALQRPNVKFLHGSLAKVDTQSKIATILEQKTQEHKTEGYDFFIAATGLRRVWPVVPQSLTKKTYMLETGRHVDAVMQNNSTVVVVGGGAVGVEMAAELKLVQPSLRVVLAHSRGQLLSAEPLPESFRERVGELVRETGVELRLNHRLSSNIAVKESNGKELREVVFENEEKITANVVVMAISRPEPATSYLPKDALTDEGYVHVRPNLQMLGPISNPDVHFAAGDLIQWSGLKRCGSAMHQGQMAAVNIHQLMQQQLYGETPQFQEMTEVPPMIGLAVGKRAISYGPDGMDDGLEVMRVFFEEDLGFRIVWDHLGLGKSPAIEANI